MPETSDLFLSAIQRQVTEAVSTISETLRKGSGVEMEIDVYGHLIIIEAKKQRISDKRF